MPECFLFLTVMFVVLAVAVGFAAASQMSSASKRSTWLGLARRFNGKAQVGGWFSGSSIRFRYGATHVLVNTWRNGRKGLCPQVLISWPDHGSTLEVLPMSFAGHYETPDDLNLGAPWFRERYVTGGNHEPTARSFLSDAVQNKIEFIRRIGKDDHVDLKLSRGRLLIRKAAPIKGYDELATFISSCLELYDQAMLTRIQGIDFVAETVNTEDISCQVCRDEITTDMVFCKRCKTPHHKECWEYNGACSTYGCSEVEFVMPRIAPPTAHYSPHERGG